MAIIPTAKLPKLIIPQTLERPFAEYFGPRGLTPEEAKNAGLVAVDKATAKALDFYPALPGIVIPYFHPLTGKLLPIQRIRYFDPPTIDGKLRRYSQPKGTPVEAYFDPTVNWKRVFADTKIPLHIVEGEIKALAANKHSFITIGLGGVDSFGGDTLTPLLNLPKWKGRVVYICYDSDTSSKEGVQRAESKLAGVLA